MKTAVIDAFIAIITIQQENLFLWKDIFFKNLKKKKKSII